MSKIKTVESLIKPLLNEVEDSYEMMGLSDGLYAGYAYDVAEKAITLDRQAFEEAICEALEVKQKEHRCLPDDGNDYDQGAWEAYDQAIATIRSIYQDNC